MGTNIDLFTEIFIILDAYDLKQTADRKHASQHLLCLTEQSTFMFFFLEVLNAITRCLNFSTCYNNILLFQLAKILYWEMNSQRRNNSVLKVLVLLLPMPHAATNHLMRVRPDISKTSKTISLTKNNRLILHLPIVTHSSVGLSGPFSSRKSFQ